MLTRLGYLVEEQGMTYIASMDADNPLASLQAANVQPRTHSKSLVATVYACWTIVCLSVHLDSESLRLHFTCISARYICNTIFSFCLGT